MSIVGDTVCDVIYRYFDNDDDELEREIYALNPHLNQLAVILPVGTRIHLPAPKINAEPEPERVVTIWD